MLTPPRRRGREANRAEGSRPRKKKRAAIARVETLEGRELLAGTVLPPPTGAPPVQVVSLPPAPPVAPSSAPAVAFAQFEPLTGRVLVQFTADAAGYNPAVLTNPANYSFSLVQAFEKQPTKSHSRPKADIFLPPPFVVTGVTLTNPVVPGAAPSVIVSINNNAPLRFGIYQFTIHSAGLVDLAGTPLNGAFSGTFPSGGIQPGGSDFVTILAQVNSTVLPALAALPQNSPPNPSGVAPGYVFFPSTRGVRVRYTSAPPGGFRLAGGNGITLRALSFQFFPGTFRLPALDASLIPGAKTTGK
jgi:hypothetical protein